MRFGFHQLLYWLTSQQTIFQLRVLIEVMVCFLNPTKTHLYIDSCTWLLAADRSSNQILHREKIKASILWFREYRIVIRFQYVFILVSCEQEPETTKCCFSVISLLFKASIGALKLVRYFCRLHGQAFCEGVLYEKFKVLKLFQVATVSSSIELYILGNKGLFLD